MILWGVLYHIFSHKISEIWTSIFFSIKRLKSGQLADMQLARLYLKFPPLSLPSLTRRLWYLLDTQSNHTLHCFIFIIVNFTSRIFHSFYLPKHSPIFLDPTPSLSSTLDGNYTLNLFHPQISSSPS